MHPCCGGSLQTGTKVIAILHLVSSIIYVVLGILAFTGGALITSVGHDEKVKATDAEREQTVVVGAVVIFFGVVVIVVGVLSILLAVLLLSGANKRNHTRCMVWFVLNAILLVMYTLEQITSIVSGKVHGLDVASHIVGILIGSYFLWVVWAFMAELKQQVEVAFYGSQKPQVVCKV